MRKIKKINGFLVVKFNDREKREYEGTALGEYGVIDAEVYTGNLDIDRGAMEYDDADTLEVAVELARGLESEEDITDEPPTYTAAVETNESYTEEAVEPTALIEGWTRRLATQVKSKHHPDTDPRTAAHELYGFKMALHQIGFLPESEVITDPDTFGAGRLDGPMPRNPEELLAFVCDERCKNRAGHTQEELDAICAKCPLGQLYEDAEAQDLRIRERSERALQEHIEGVRRAEDTVTALLGGHEALAYLAALRDGQILQENECEHYAAQIADIISAPCPPTIPAHCDGVSCRACWLAWLTGEPLKGKEPPDKRTAPDDAPAYYHPPVKAIREAAERIREGRMEYVAEALTRPSAPEEPRQP